MDIELLNRSLEVTENPGLETTDPRFTDIATLMQEAKYLEAAMQSQAVIEEGIYDIRIISYFLYGIFLDQGVVSLAPLFRCLSGLFGDNWPAVGPTAKKEKHAQTSMRWFVTQLQKKLEYEEKKKGDQWNAWISQVSSDEIQEALDASDDLRRSLGMTLEEAAGPVLDGLMKIKEWLRSFQQLVYRELEAEPETEETVEPEVSVETVQSAPRTAGRQPQEGYSAPTAPAADDVTYAEGSYQLKILMRKMQAFEQLIEQEKFPRAALVAEDINNIIATFDPRVYFPKLFTKFSFLFATNINEIASYEEHKETLEWQALKEFYKVDLDGFIDF